MTIGLQQPILLVEDSPEDYEVTVRALRRAGLSNPIFHCESGEQAIEFLQRTGRYASEEPAPRPGIILLDLNLPGTDGREVLETIKSDANLCAIPVVILTTSTDERDIERCYSVGANSYIKKPVDLEKFIRAIQLLKDFWFEVVVLPRPGGVTS